MSLNVNGGVIEEFRRQIINEAVKDLLAKFTTMVETSLGVLNNGHGSNGKTVVKMVKDKKRRAKKLCAAGGCQNPFAPRFGGFCVDHRTSSGYRAWRTRRMASQTTYVTMRAIRADCRNPRA